MKRLLIVAVLSTAFPAFSADQTADNFLVGNWAWTSSKNNCTESYDFRSNGTAFFVSGDEKSDMKYSLSEKLNANGRRALSLVTVKDHGGKDCVDSTVDDTGKSYALYVEFSNSKTQMIICQDPKGGKCYGPIRKVNAGK